MGHHLARNGVGKKRLRLATLDSPAKSSKEFIRREARMYRSDSHIAASFGPAHVAGAPLFACVSSKTKAKTTTKTV
jgi:hypothetical protein